MALPVAYSINTNEVRLSFSGGLDREVAEDIESYGAEAWNYKWSANYGSPDFSVENAEKQGRDSLKITNARLEDERTVVLEIPGLKKAHQLAISYNLETSEGEPVQSAIYATVNSLGEQTARE